MPRLILAAVALCSIATSASSQEVEPDSELGKHIYVDGLLANGEPLMAIAEGDIAVSGVQLTCSSCHRGSGYGSSEGGRFVPAITGPTLYAPRVHDRADLFKKLYKEHQPQTFWSRVRSPRARPAYTDATLARLIREGVDPSGREIEPLMPRYEIHDADMANLVAYLRSLSTGSDPGVDEERIYFATVVSENGDPKKREAVLATLRKFVEWMNLDTAGDTRNPNFSPNYRSDFMKAYRIWELEVWDLRGNPETWTRQVDDYYRKRPVFAVVSGLVDGPWSPVQEFCEREKVPCLFPQTDLPVTDAENRYSIHFNRGLVLEAEVLATHFAEPPWVNEAERIVQFHVSDPYGEVPAQTLVRELARAPDIKLATRSYGAASELRQLLDALLAEATDTTQSEILVLWPGRFASIAFEWLEEHSHSTNLAERIYLPSAALELVPENLDPVLEARLRFVHPYEIPGNYHPRAFRVRAWMRTRGIELHQARLQFNAHYALTILQYGLEHIVDNFSRDYLVEYVEHEAESALNPGTFPRLSLGPGQRFASKGAYIVKLSSEGKHPIEPVTAWIVR